MPSGCSEKASSLRCGDWRPGHSIAAVRSNFISSSDLIPVHHALTSLARIRRSVQPAERVLSDCDLTAFASMALAASLGRLLQHSAARVSQSVPAVAAGVHHASIFTTSAARHAAVPAPVEELEPAEPSAAAQKIDWKQNLGEVRNDWT